MISTASHVGYLELPDCTSYTRDNYRERYPQEIRHKTQSAKERDRKTGGRGRERERQQGASKAADDVIARLGTDDALVLF
jgi:hypothetical protein